MNGHGYTYIQSRLAAWQLERGLKNHEAAAQLGVPLETYRHWRYGARRPRTETLQHIESVLGRVCAADGVTGPEDGQNASEGHLRAITGLSGTTGGAQ